MPSIFDVTGFLTPFISRVADLIPDPEKRAEAKEQATTEMLNFVTTQNNAQLAVDQAEANNKNVFVAGWRPFIGWICGMAFAWKYVLQPSLVFVMAAFRHPVAVPTLDDEAMTTVMLGMLGLGGMRTYEKVQGVAPNGAQ